MTILSNSYADVPDPVIVPGLSSGILSIGAGGFHSCAVIQGATAVVGASAVCWGKNVAGQLGIGSNYPSFSPSPLPVIGLEYGVASLAAGFEHTCARMMNGSVYCWGSNENGEIGQGYLSASISPITVPSLVTGLPLRAIQVAAGGYHSCALLDDGAVYCWGRCMDAEIGDNTPVCSMSSPGKPLPSAVYGLGAGSGIIKISTGRLHSCGVMANGSVVCWGGEVSPFRAVLFLLTFLLQQILKGSWATTQ
jgi:alpha-tubulin suppressor-like RCC1 family protein